MLDTHTATDATRWQAVVSRDPAADGQFLLGVRTTHIYCRPSCPARKPKRENVTFFATAEEARQAGFRACKRCRPDDPATDRLGVAVVTAAAGMIDRAVAAEEPLPSLATLAGHSGYSPFHLHRLFKKALGLTPKAYGQAGRSRRMGEALRQEASVTDAIHSAGYSSASRFYDTAAARLGMTPSARRRGGAGETIRYAVTQTSLGPLVVAATAKGICAIEFGDNRLAERFPQATLIPADASFAGLIAAAAALVEAPGMAQALPLDVRGTAFQEQVWQALRRIAPGRTESYAGIAAAIGKPKAARAVAMACAANPAAVVIPCHRVVHADGSLSGYRWGPERKRQLLQREKPV